jgi:hypothetical protein
MKSYDFLPSSHVENIQDYPFGRLRTTGTAYLEFDPKKGFRFVRQLVDPKTGRKCAPKKSTYEECAIPCRDDNGYFTWYALNMNCETEKMESVCNQIADVWHLWTREQQLYIIKLQMMFVKVKVKVGYQYSGFNPSNGIELSEIFPVYDSVMENMKKGWEDESINPFRNCAPDMDLYNSLISRVPENYSPFKVTQYQITRAGMVPA